MRHLIGDAPQQEALRSGHPLVPDDDEVDAFALGDLADHVGRIAVDALRLDRHARLAVCLLPLRENLLAVLRVADVEQQDLGSDAFATSTPTSAACEAVTDPSVAISIFLYMAAS